MMMPTIHMNGTSKDEILRQLDEAREAVQNAVTKLKACHPNGRDYYTQGSQAIGIATQEHDARMKHLWQVDAELYEIYAVVVDA